MHLDLPVHAVGPDAVHTGPGSVQATAIIATDLPDEQAARRHLAVLYGLSTVDWQRLATVQVP